MKRIQSKFVVPSLVAASILVTQPAVGQDKDPQKPVTDDTVTMGDAATTPITDLNLQKDEIPDILKQARKDPYDHTGLRRCSEIASAVGELDAILGDDLDIAERKGGKLGAGEIAQMAVGSFIPFRGLIREISGAKGHEREFRDAIVAGMMRRSYLKGLGQQKGCRYPARPATQEVLDAIEARQKAEAEAEQARKEAKKRDKDRRKNKGDDETQFVSQPVVQPVD